MKRGRQLKNDTAKYSNTWPLENQLCNELIESMTLIIAIHLTNQNKPILLLVCTQFIYNGFIFI